MTAARSGFTPIELLATIAIIGLLVALLLPAGGAYPDVGYLYFMPTTEEAGRAGSAAFGPDDSEAGARSHVRDGFKPPRLTVTAGSVSAPVCRSESGLAEGGQVSCLQVVNRRLRTIKHMSQSAESLSHEALSVTFLALVP